MGTDFDVVVVGAGFAGLYALHRLRALGFSARCFERGTGVGGTWYWNRYPGARCDTESISYSYSFSPELEQEWEWSERYAAQPEILDYLNHVADRFDLRRDISFETFVDALRWDPEGHWTVTTDGGETTTAQFVILAVGCVSSRLHPARLFRGVDSFHGEWHHTAAWPKEGVELAGRRIGVIGTGSTGMQLAPAAAEHAEHVHVFQRTPNYSVPMGNHPLDDDYHARVKSTYRDYRARQRASFFGVPVPPAAHKATEVSPQARSDAFQSGWRDGGLSRFLTTFSDVMADERANGWAGDFVRDKIAETVKDPTTARKLMPYNHAIGSRRIPISDVYFGSYNRANVTLHDARDEALVEITPKGVKTQTVEYELDLIAYAVGFDGMTGAQLDIDIRGRGGVSLRDAWSDHPSMYLGLAIAGFPNLFGVTGPGSPSVLSNMVTSIEEHVDWITACLVHLRERGHHRIEPLPDAQEQWVEHVDTVASGTLFPKARSWWTGTNVPGKKRAFTPYVGGLDVYLAKCRQVVDDGYAGFALR
jgi:cyclohexanone monooxygenase